MKIAKILFPGQFQDAFAYRGRIALFTKNHSIRFIELDRFAKELEALFPNSIPITRMLFARNDWLLNPQFRDLIRNPKIRAACLEAANSILNPPNFEEKPYREAEWDVGVDYDFLLDLNIYNGRVYVGNENGLFSSDVDWKHVRDEKPTFEERQDGTTIGISARYGTVNVSSPDRGLYSSIDEFNVLGLENSGCFTDVAKNSLRSSWCQYQVVNYTGSAGVEIYPTSHEKKSFGAKGEKEREVLSSIVTDSPFGLAHIPLAPTQKGSNLKRIPWEKIDFSFNLNQAFYLHQQDGPFCIVKIAYKERRDAYLKSVVFGHQKFDKRILSYHEVSGGAVLETLSKVQLLTDDGDIIDLHPKPPISIRTYPKSKSYQSLVTIVDEEGLWLHTLIPDEMFDPTAVFGSNGKLVRKPQSETETANAEDEDESDDEEEDLEE